VGWRCLSAALHAACDRGNDRERGGSQRNVHRDLNS
jgi:hypothetical protein